MILIEGFLGPEKLAELRTILQNINYLDGNLSAGLAARQVKNNQQKDERHPDFAKANELVRAALVGSEKLQEYAFPYKVTPIRFSKYGKGMQYGDHLDAAVMPVPGAVIRTDVSFTLFLSPPENYEGGELVVRTDFAERVVKADAGDLVAYDSGNLHRVNEVLDGEREVAVGWIQSIYANSEQRQVLSSISKVRQAIFTEQGQNDHFKLLNKACITLERMWTNP